MPARDVDQALASSGNILRELLKIRESQWFERKSGRVTPRDLAVPLVALANAEGGTVVVGLHDGEVDGVPEAKMNDIRQVAHDFTHPPVRVRLTEIPLPDSDKAIVVLHVEPGDHVHETAKGECYLRVGDESRRLTFAQRRELEFDRGSAPYDGTAVNATIEDLAADAVAAYQRLLGSSTPELMLVARSLVTPDRRLNVAGYLLFGSHPDTLFPNAHVRILRYLSPERGTGNRLTLADDGDIRCEGPIPRQIQRAAETVEALIPKRRSLTSSGRFEGVPIIPRDAWLEGLVNAVVHRSYSNAGDHVRVELFPDRIEITSPGRFPGLADPASPLNIGRHARNPRIARVCSDLGLAQELGEGIRRIFAEMRSSGLTDPLYTQSADAVRLTLTAADAVAPELRDSLPAGARASLDALRAAGRPLGTGQLAALLGIARPTAGRHLQSLREAGLISWQGESSKDPRATWAIR